MALRRPGQQRCQWVSSISTHDGLRTIVGSHFSDSDPAEFNHYVAVIPANGGEPRDIARGDALGGLAWTPDGSGVVYSSSQGSTVLYPPTMNLRMAPLDGGGDQQLTFGDDSFVQPDIDASGALTVSRVKTAVKSLENSCHRRTGRKRAHGNAHYEADLGGTGTIAQPR